MGDVQAWLVKARALLESNQVNVAPYRYTRPAPSRYEHQWLWDSCFHAIIYRHFDPRMACDELLSVVAKQVQSGPDAGMIPHMTYWRGGGGELWGDDTRSIITQPPLIAIAAQRVYEKHPDNAFLARLYPSICAYHQWFDRRRDTDNDDLVCIIHPWESGWDASPRWDRPMGLSENPSDEEAREARKNLVAILRQYDNDPQRLMDNGYFCVESADFNAIRAADLESLGWMAETLGKTDESSQWRQKARRVQEAIRQKMTFGERVYDLAGPDETAIAEPTAGEFVTLFGGVPSAETAQALVERLQLPANWPRFPVPTSPTTASLFRGNRYWRGNVWLNVNWLIWSGLRRYGYYQLAQMLTERSLALVELSGWHEYFHPDTGEGYGSFPHSWSALVLDMLIVDT